MITNKKAQFSLLLFSLFTVGFFLFYQGLDNPFVFDDIHKIKNNPDLKTSQFSLDSFFHNYELDQTSLHNDPSRPVTFVLYWLLMRAGDGSPFPFHLASVILHIFCALLVGGVAFRMTFKVTGQESFLAAFIASFGFLLLPLNAGTVIYAYGLSDVLSAFFSLLIIFLTLEPDRTRWLSISMCFVLALFSKQSAAVLPLMVLVIDFLKGGITFLKERRKLHLLLFGLLLVYLGWRWIYFGRIGDLEAYNTFPVDIYVPLQGVVIWLYFLRTWVPFNLTIDQSFTPAMFEYWQCWLSWGAIALLTILSCLPIRKNQMGQWLSFAWLFFFLALLPTGSFFPTTDLMVERRAYLASAGLLIGSGGVIAIYLKSLRDFKLVRIFLFSLILILYSFYAKVTHERIRVYGNPESLWREAMALFPRNERPRVNLISYYLENGNFVRAEEQLKELEVLYPKHFLVFRGLAHLYQHPGNPNRNPEKAFSFYQLVLAQEPQDYSVLYNLGILMLEMNQLDQAVNYFKQVLQLNRNYSKARLGLVDALIRQKRYAEAESEVRIVLEREPENTKAQSFLSAIPKQQ